MSSMGKLPVPDSALEHAITNFIESIAINEKAIANVLNSVADMVQNKNKSTDKSSVEDICEAIEKIIDSTARLQYITQARLDRVGGLIQSYQDNKYYENYGGYEE